MLLDGCTEINLICQWIWMLLKLELTPVVIWVELERIINQVVIWTQLLMVDSNHQSIVSVGSMMGSLDVWLVREWIRVMLIDALILLQWFVRGLNARPAFVYAEGVWRHLWRRRFVGSAPSSRSPGINSSDAPGRRCLWRWFISFIHHFRLGFFGLVWDRLGSSGIVWDHLGSSKFLYGVIEW